MQSQKEKKVFLNAHGIKEFHEHAFTRVPHFDVCKMIPYDFMHVELEGTLKNELAAMLFYFLRKRRWGFTLEKLNARIREYDWPNDCSITLFTTGYLNKGTEEGKCKKGAHVHMTAGDMLIFVRHSIDLMLPLIGDTEDPLWKCWVTHVRYVRILLQHQIKSSDIIKLDRLIYEHHQCLLELNSEEYGKRLFKPKNHMASHFPEDIRNLGPVRTYWCMRFEALNQLFKTFAKTGSFQSVCKRCAQMWTLRSARFQHVDALRLKAEQWGSTSIVQAGNERLLTRADVISSHTTESPIYSRHISGHAVGQPALRATNFSHASQGDRVFGWQDLGHGFLQRGNHLGLHTKRVWYYSIEWRFH